MKPKIPIHRTYMRHCGRMIAFDTIPGLTPGSPEITQTKPLPIRYADINLDDNDLLMSERNRLMDYASKVTNAQIRACERATEKAIAGEEITNDEHFAVIFCHAPELITHPLSDDPSKVIMSTKPCKAVWVGDHWVIGKLADDKKSVEWVTR